jgi:hypothetical protein
LPPRDVTICTYIAVACGTVQVSAWYVESNVGISLIFFRV